ncbi:hypothetical protein HPP92_009425 [Vanilla planifolia]|uniref:Uncharacterized protein n=1 Tax=Vanilla planifolia TaxID=51239 RepID=A0A835V866_VANPL|nr:hypothetical protein HPP92_009425 [Vanilla planifolia]
MVPLEFLKLHSFFHAAFFFVFITPSPSQGTWIHPVNQIFIHAALLLYQKCHPATPASPRRRLFQPPPANSPPLTEYPTPPPTKHPPLPKPHKCSPPPQQSAFSAANHNATTTCAAAFASASTKGDTLTKAAAAIEGEAIPTTSAVASATSEGFYRPTSAVPLAATSKGETMPAAAKGKTMQSTTSAASEKPCPPTLLIHRKSDLSPSVVEMENINYYCNK